MNRRRRRGDTGTHIRTTRPSGHVQNVALSKGSKVAEFDLYELAGAKWQKLPDLESSADAVTKLVWSKLDAQAKKTGKKLESLTSVMQQRASPALAG